MNTKVIKNRTVLRAGEVFISFRRADVIDCSGSLDYALVATLLHNFAAKCPLAKGSGIR